MKNFICYLGLSKDQFVRVQITSQFEDRILTGFYTCGDNMGELLWRKGLLQSCYETGKWLLLEDLHKASSDVLTVIQHFLADSSADSFQGNEFVPGFQLIATCEPDYSGNLLPSLKPLCSNSFDFKVCHVPAFTDQELRDIIIGRYPNISEAITKLLILKSFLSEVNCKFSLHNFFKYCFVLSLEKKLEAEIVCQTALDFFTVSISDEELKLSIAEEIVSTFNFSKENARYFTEEYKPDVKIDQTTLTIGRCKPISSKLKSGQRASYALTKPALIIVENVILSIQNKFPVLLCGETGTGKTSCVQFLAQQFGTDLTVLNMSHQSTSADLIGGFKPVSLSLYLRPIKIEFENLFKQSFNVQKNKKFLSHVNTAFFNEKFSLCLRLMNHVCETVSKEHAKFRLWKSFEGKFRDVVNALNKREKSGNSLMFSFVEGCLLQAMKNGSWLLLDEINLACPETLDCLLDVLANRRVFVDERGDKRPVFAHESFRLFACMNPATDVGKTELPSCVRNHFREFYFPQTYCKSDLSILVNHCLKKDVKFCEENSDKIVTLYSCLQTKAKNGLLFDSENKRANISLRSLARALKFISKTRNCSAKKACAEAFMFAVSTGMNQESRKIIVNEINATFPNFAKDVWTKHSATCVNVEGIWLDPIGNAQCVVDENYILTDTVKKHLKQIASIVMAGRDPVLLQGETSVGKTSLIHYLAKILGQKVWRINNHEHTDIQEYLGAYCTSKTGELVFEDGILIKAMKNGHWVILDELNLAPTEVLEALNRLLDDNREIFVPETNKLVKAHPQFMLFGTQNPAGSYSGRKILSRAFRDRFVQISFDQIPEDELKIILSKRCQLPASYSTKIIEVMKKLHSQRCLANLFAGKSSFITLRDLFRWANRYTNVQVESGNSFFDWNSYLAKQGFMLLGGRARNETDLQIIKQCISSCFKADLNEETIFDFWDDKAKVNIAQSLSAKYLSKIREMEHNGGSEVLKVAWTSKMMRLAVLVSNALENKEPVLLIGETGCGKTTLCQILATAVGQQLFTVNCNMNSDASDFIGSLRPVRNRSSDDVMDTSVIEAEEETTFQSKAACLFEWQDGPVVLAAKTGGLLLLDEISLADDSVLERLNSLFEQERTLLVAENTQNDVIDEVTVKDDFRVVATMNPSGDYGKKELSIALRNRFTEIWCPSDVNKQDIKEVVEKCIEAKTACDEKVKQWICEFILKFLKDLKITIRDLKSWIEFIYSSTHQLEIEQAYVEGAWLVFLDSIELSNVELKNRGADFLKQQTGISAFSAGQQILIPKIEKDLVSVAGFWYKRNPRKEPEDQTETEKDTPFDFRVPTTNENMVKIMRGLAIRKPILIEGQPGIGKTALVEKVASLLGYKLVRINLSEQTDINDLLGNDLPNVSLEGFQPEEELGNEKPIFCWHDGPLLAALNAGHWVLLDEINLASQSVLEGLNSLFDHRGEVFISELNRTFHLKSNSTRFFATQNPAETTHGRKSLPRSFLNRFSKIYMESLKEADYNQIFANLLPDTSEEFRTLVLNLISWNEELNLRDVLRFAKCVKHFKQGSDAPVSLNFESALNFIVEPKIQLKSEDTEKTLRVLSQNSLLPVFSSEEKLVKCGKFTLEKKSSEPPSFSDLQNSFDPETVESILGCLSNNFPVLITGSSGYGKIEIIKQLGALVGHEVFCMNLNSCTDVLDLFGKYTNFDAQILLKSCISSLSRKIKAILRTEKTPRELADKLFISLICLHSCASFENLSNFKLLLKNMNKHSGLETKQMLQEIEDCVRSSKRDRKFNNFVWENTVLIDSLRNGHWLVLQNVDLCSCAILDRLNSLLEQNGQLLLGELSTNENGEVVSIKPHPEFRIFLTTSKTSHKSAVVSSAMYNRCVVIRIDDDKLELEDELINEKRDSTMLSDFHLYKQKLHSWVQKPDSLVRLFEQQKRPDEINALVCILEHQKSDSTNESVVKCSLKYILSLAPEWTVLLEKLLPKLLSSGNFNLPVEADSLWGNLALIEESDNKYLQALETANKITEALIYVMNERTVDSFADANKDPQTQQELVALGSTLSQTLKMKGNKSDVDVCEKFVHLQKIFKWFQYVYFEFFKSSDCDLSRVLPFVSHRFETLLNNSSLAVQKTKFKSLTKAFKIDLIESLSEKLSNLFKDDSIIEFASGDSDFVEEMEVDEIANLDPEELASNIPAKLPQLEPDFWIELIASSSMKKQLLYSLYDVTINDVSIDAGFMPSLALQNVSNLMSYVADSLTFEVKFVMFLCWARLWNKETELIRSRLEEDSKKLISAPTLETFGPNFSKVTTLYFQLWKNSGFLVFKEEELEKLNNIVDFISEKLSRTNLKNDPTVCVETNRMKLCEVGLQLFEKCVSCFSLFDPAEELLHKKGAQILYIEHSQNYFDMKVNLYKILTGYSEEKLMPYLLRHPKMKIIQKMLEKSKCKLEKYQTNPYQREPNTTKYRQVVETIASFYKSVLEHSLSGEADLSKVALDQLTAIETSAFSFIKVMLQDYPDYIDILYLPFSGLCLILIDIEQQKLLRKQTKEPVDDVSMTSLVTKGFTLPSWESFLLSDVSVENIEHVLSLCQLFPYSWKCMSNSLLRANKRFVSKLFSRMYKLWRESEQRDLDKQIEQEKGYVYRSKSKLGVFNTDALIPDEPNDSEETSPDKSMENQEAGNQKETEFTFSVEHYFLIWKAQDAITHAMLEGESECLTEFDSDLLKLLNKWTKQSILSFNYDQKWLKSLIIEVNFHLAKYYRTENSTKGDNIYNIYTDSNVPEFSKCGPLLKDLKRRVNELFTEWPEHPTLCQIIKSADRMLYAFPVDKPVVFMSVCLESLLALCNSWETVAAKYVSLQQHIAPLKQLLIHWRSLELTFWKQSMQYHQRQVYMSVARFWFNLFSLFVQTINEQITVEQLTIALSKFLQTSKVGEFQARLDILKSWAKYCKLFNKIHLYSTVMNLIDYYKGVLNRITKHQENQVSLLRQELKSFIKIQQWRDFNIFSLKESVKRCKVKIRKVLRDYSKLLDEPVKDHLFLKKEDADTSQIVAKKKSTSNLLEGPKILGGFSVSSDRVSNTLSNVYKASEVFQSKLSSFKKCLRGLNESCENLQSDNASIKTHLSDCHKESRDLEQKISNSKDEEEKKKLLSTAKFQMQKRRGLFKDLVDYLISLSFSYKRSLNSNVSVTSLFEQIPTYVMNSFSSDLKKCKEKSLFVVHQYAAFSNIASTPNSELDAQVVQVCTGFVNDMVSEMFSFWKNIQGVLSFISETETVVKEMKTFYGDNLNQNSALISRTHPKFSQLSANLISTAEECTQFLWYVKPIGIREAATPAKPQDLKVEGALSIESSNDVKRVTDLALKFLKSPLVGNILKNTSEVLEIKLVTSEVMVLDTFVTEMLQALECCTQKGNDINPFISALKASFESLMYSCDTCKTDIINCEKQQIVDIEPTEKDLNKFCISAVNKAQKLRDDLPNMLESLETFPFHQLKKAIEFIQDVVDSHQKVSPLKKFRNAVARPMNLHPENVYLLEPSSLSSLHLACASSCFFTDSLRLVVNDYARMFSSFLDLTQTCNQLFLDLMTHGFCVPKQLKESMSSGLEKQTGGFEEAGIDEGTGSKDVSDKIETEDQLKMEQKGNEEKDEDEQKGKNEDKDDENQPIDVSEDFDAHLEDVQINDESDSDSGDNDANDEENIDDKFGGDGNDDGNQDEQQQEEINDEFWGEDDDDKSDKENGQDDEQDKKNTDDKNQKGMEANDEKSRNEADDIGENDEQVDSNEMSKDGAGNEEKTDEGKMQAANEDDSDELDEANQEETEENENDEKDAKSKMDEKVDDTKTEDLDGEKDRELDEAMEQEMALGNDDESDDGSNEDEKSPEEMKDGMIDDNKSDSETGADMDEEPSGPADDEDQDDLEQEKGDQNNENDANEVGKSEENMPQDEPGTEDSAVSTVLESLPTDQVDSEAKDQCGGAAPQNEQESSGINENSAPQNLDSSELDNKDNASKSSYNVFSYGDDKQGGKRNLTEEDRQVGTEDEPVEKKGKIQDADNVENGKPPEKLNKDVTYQHVKEDQKHDVQMFDDSKELENMENVYKAVEEVDEDFDEDAVGKNDENNPIEDSDDDNVATEDENKGIASQLKDTKAPVAEVEEDPENKEIESDVIQPEETEPSIFDSGVVAPSENLLRPVHDDLEKLKSSLEDICAQWSDTKCIISSTSSASNDLWLKYESLTFNLSRQLAEQIKMILEPLQSGRLQGDYRSGKRLNMKKLIPYIASGYRKDKIWLRRTKPQKRNYQVMIAIDDSESMADGKTRSAAFEAIATLTTALALVEVGQIAVAKFGEDCHLIHKFDEPFTVNSGAKVLQQFNFDQPKTKIADLMKLSTEYLLMNKNLPGQTTQEQLLIIISDGRGLFVEGESELYERFLSGLYNS